MIDSIITGVVCAAVAWTLGLLMGLSLGYRFGTQRTVMIFKKHFPTTQTLNALVSILLKASKSAEETKKP